MYESARAHMKPRDIRRRAYSLMRQCWKTLLIAAVLMGLFGWGSDAVEAHGKHLAQQAYDAHKKAFIAENPPPEGKEDSEEWAFSREWLADYEAEQAYNEVYTPWEWLGYGIALIDLLFSCVIAVRLSKGLLTALRGGECTPHYLLSGWARISTACWLALQRWLRVMGWSLLPLLLHVTLDFLFGIHADTVARLLMLPIFVWATLHYALAEVHLADAPDGSRTASDNLRLAVDDADAFTIRAMCRVLWPVVLPYFIIVGIGILKLFAPVPLAAEAIVCALCNMLMNTFLTAGFVCIYDEIRRRIQAAEEAVPPGEGLTRARALIDCTNE